MLAKYTKRFPANAAHTLNSFVIFVSLPSVVLVQVTHLWKATPLAASMAIPVSMAWILFFLSLGFFSSVGKRLNWTSARIGALTLTGGLSNTSFVGFAMLEALYGVEALKWGVLIDQPGSFLVLATLGLILASRLGHPRDGIKRSTLKQVLTFPPFLALVFATALGFSAFDLSEGAKFVFSKMGATLVPVALFSVGFQLKLNPSILRRYAAPLSIGLLFKLVLVPCFFLCLYGFILQDTSFMTRVTIIESAMATMIMAAVMAADFGLDEELANLMVGISIPLSFFTVPLWDRILSTWF